MEAGSQSTLQPGGEAGPVHPPGRRGGGSRSEVIEASRYVSEFGGGKGAVRDIVEQVLRAQDEWAKDRTGVLGVASR